MKAIGTLLRIIAIILFFALFVTTAVSYSIDAEELKESREELEEERDEHDDEIMYEEYGDHDSSDCYQCENFDDREKRYDRSETRNILSLVLNITSYLFYSGILFGLGQLVAAKGKKSEPEAVQIPAPAPAPVQAPVGTMACPNCGNAIREGARFCNKCGTIIGN